MKFRLSLVACAALVALPAAAQAACYHNGVAYGVGAKLCQNGWLVECTPASYWKAIGQCLKDDKAEGAFFTPVSARSGLSIKAGAVKVAETRAPAR